MAYLRLHLAGHQRGIMVGCRSKHLYLVGGQLQGLAERRGNHMLPGRVHREWLGLGVDYVLQGVLVGGGGGWWEGGRGGGWGPGVVDDHWQAEIIRCHLQQAEKKTISLSFK